MKLVSVLLLFLLVSCKKSDNLVLFDEYYSELYPVKADNKFNFEVVKINDFVLDMVEGYNNVVISPMLYQRFSHVWSDYEGVLYIIEWEGKLLKDSHQNIMTNDASAYEDLMKSLSKDKSYKNKRFGIITDSYNVQDEKELNIITDFFRGNYNYSALTVTDSTTRSDIKDFISNNDDIGFWIINSSSFGLYIYELLPSDDDIVINDGLILYGKDSNIIYSIEKKFNDNLNKVFNKKSFEITTELKKY